MLSASGPRSRLLERHHIFHSRDPEETRASGSSDSICSA
jgi:hypothetical protein